MEERKRRVTRKYLRERTNIVQGDAEVPFEDTADESVIDSERFVQPEVDFQRQEPPPPPAPPRPLPVEGNEDWLLTVDPMTDDPYADPFSKAAPEDSSRKKEDWLTWGMEPNPSSFGGVQRDSWYDRRSQEAEHPQSYDLRRESLLKSRDPRSFSSEGKQPGFQQQESIMGGYPELFGRQQKGQSGHTGTGLDLLYDKGFNPTLDQSRSAQPGDRPFGSRSQMKPHGYTPYKSPYQTQREQQQRGSYRPPEQEYKRQDSFQKWKDKNQSRFDPSRDDAYIDELMPNTGN
jgi:hypothetical protein